MWRHLDSCYNANERNRTILIEIDGYSRKSNTENEKKVVKIFRGKTKIKEEINSCRILERVKRTAFNGVDMTNEK